MKACAPVAAACGNSIHPSWYGPSRRAKRARARPTGRRHVVTRSDVDDAAARIRPWARRTPVMAGDDPDVWFKLEYLQHTGSFKARGALNRLLAAREAGELDP